LLRSEVAGVKLRRLPKGMEGEAFTAKMPSRCVIGGTVWAIHKVRGRGRARPSPQLGRGLTD